MQCEQCGVYTVGRPIATEPDPNRGTTHTADGLCARVLVGLSIGLLARPSPGRRPRRRRRRCHWGGGDVDAREPLEPASLDALDLFWEVAVAYTHQCVFDNRMVPRQRLKTTDSAKVGKRERERGGEIEMDSGGGGREI